MDGKSIGPITLQELLSWKVYVDGAANQRWSGVGLVLVSPEKITIEKSLRLGCSAINNEAEYEALLMEMTMVQRIGRKVVEMFSDSRLVVGQVVRTYMSHLLGTYVTILCNWLILWQNALYLYLDRSRMCLILQETLFQDQVLKTYKSVQDSS